ncbi:phosphate/phosphite/phosphonate ABC transporter substrate-binding protein [Alisedimentitalea sp. MJ-SS2]|uniref:phosphate/phosphite/phosphonate ABC transporter substrate-binding protein n=1 Tax=Aliisedimentitalea sp. MJ-SS2 TaxID=3049795 RepID=UPI00290DFF34|nr:phosphate/phosphite/phosphonate ABC transporter substrate-binding protein [Alisedimentitalea sp. MJ-SS2]MDU8926764.1 phosphate/phosphite/phosphonate ABC transporter substrate-binding protein [Alisedimentitalea sp. MJ-SS2]
MNVFKALIASVCSMLILGAPAFAGSHEDCHRGTLDDAYCDRNLDQTADLPLDPADWVDPSTIIFTYTPVEDPAVYANIWQGFVDHMAEVTGRKVVFFPVQSNAAQLEAMRSGRLHVAGFNTGSNPIAVSCAGFVPFGMMAYDDGSFGYEMEIIVPADSPMTSPDQIKGKTMAFTSPTSNSGFKAPSAILKGEFDLVAERDFTPTYSGKHDNSILGVYNGDYEVAAVANSVLQRMIRRGVIEEGKIRTIYKSQTFPTTGYGTAHNLHPELTAKIKTAFWTYEWDENFKKEFKKADRFVGITHKFDWAVIRQIDTANGVSYDCK